MLCAGIEEEGMNYRFVKVYYSTDLGIIASRGSKLSGSGICVAIAYTRRAMGPFAGFITGLSVLIMYTIAIVSTFVMRKKAPTLDRPFSAGKVLPVLALIFVIAVYAVAVICYFAYGKKNIKDIMAVDTIVPKEVQGNLAKEFAMEKAVGIAAMVKTEKRAVHAI